MARKVSDTSATGEYFRKVSKNVSPSTKTPKPAGRVFGASSQFRGVQSGVKGDPRK